MRIPMRDVIATALVAVAVAIYLFWVADLALPGMSGVRATGTVLLGLGFAASAIAVVPGFDELIHGSKTYLAVTSVLGLAAFAGGLLMLIAASSAGLALMMACMVTMWAIATVHHVMLTGSTHGVHAGQTA